MHRYITLLLGIFIVFALTPAQAKRLALVIGNGDYKSIPSLPHSVNDAKSITTALRKFNFQVALRLNLNERNMNSAIDDFKLRLRSGDIGLFYFSGYALQSDGNNYLVPRWVSILNKANIKFKMIAVNDVLRKMEQANPGGINIIILEASRENPYKKHVELTKGLAKMRSTPGTLIAFAAAPNQLSDNDSNETNSFYTQHLLAALPKKANLTLPALFTVVKKQVEAKGKPVPWHSASLKGPICFGTCSNPQSQLSQLLLECNKHLKANRLTSGQGGTALACYQNVLAQDQTNAEALAGLKKIENRYVTWIKRALKKGQQGKAKRYLSSLRKVNPSAPTTLANFEAWLHRPKASVAPQIQFTPNTFTAGQTFRDRLQVGHLGPEMVWIPAGQFQIGDSQGIGNPDELPVHDVFIEGFAMGRYEITFEDYEYFTKATNRKKPKDNGWGRGNRPVIFVSWQDATAYAEWLTEQTGRYYRLPTEAEWEYAARAGTKTIYWWGNEIGENRANCAGSGTRWDDKQTAPIGSFAPNPFGLYDTAGNVWEWTCSVYEKKYFGAYQSCIEKNSRRERQLRGGSWFLNSKLCRVGIRNSAKPSSTYNNVGFRVVTVPD